MKIGTLVKHTKEGFIGIVVPRPPSCEFAWSPETVTVYVLNEKYKRTYLSGRSHGCYGACAMFLQELIIEE